MFRFKGHKFNGVHPEDNKGATNQVAIEELPVQEGDLFYIPVAQHIGAPANVIVKKGQEVKAGEIIAESSGFVSANIHASVNGVVTAIGQVDYPVSGKANCIIIQASADQSHSFDKLSGDTVVDIIKSAGIVGMGGAMFPTNIKLSPKEKIHTLIINGVECEPYLTCDHRQMLERTKDLVMGALIIKDALKIDRVVVGIEANKPDAAKAINIEANGVIDVRLLPMIYPQGGEKQLILTITDKELEDGKLPASMGVIVQNVSTVLAVYDAVKKNKPLISRVVTVTKDVHHPKNILAPIGTPIQRLLDFCGGATGEIEKITLGGPMTGFDAHSTKIPVYKGMNGVLVNIKREKRRGFFTPRAMACMRCGWCATVCPIGLSPVLLEDYYRVKNYEKLLEWHLLSCIECSACNYNCPSLRPLKIEFKLGKGEVMKLLRAKQEAEKNEPPKSESNISTAKPEGA